MDSYDKPCPECHLNAWFVNRDKKTKAIISACCTECGYKDLQIKVDQDNVLDAEEKQQAIRQHLSKPRPQSHACGCMGQATLPGYEDKPWGPERKVEPLCYCRMSMVEQVNGKYYLIKEVRSPVGISFKAELLGPVGGPYTVDGYGQPV